jgi:RNA polymerase sigma-70 factor (ECF subfamily)
VRNRALHALDKRRLRDADELTERSSEHAPVDVALRRHLLAALATLSPVQREIVLLHDLDGWSHAELAEALGLSEVNCRQHLFTARRALRAELSALGPNEEARHGTGT